MSESAGSVAWRVRKVLRIARWEVENAAGGLDRTTVVLAVLGLVLAAGVGGATLAAGGVALDADLYRVAVDEESPYHAPVERADSLEAVPPDAPAGAWNVRVIDPNTSDAEATVEVGPTRKAEAALSAFRSAVQASNDARLRAASNQSAAFPVRVTLVYRERAALGPGTSESGQEGDAAGGNGDSGGSGGAGDGDGGGQAETGSGSDGPLGIPDVGTALFSDSQAGAPGDIRPPFPFASLVLAFAFLVPMNFVIQAYGSTVLNERINRRGELLLVSPVAPTDIVAGKTLPYLAASVAVTVGIALAVGGGLVSVLAVLPVALLFLAATFVGGMFARSFKELTFVTVAVSVFLTTYAFVPAIFSNVTPIALISPLTLVVRDLQGVAVTLGEYLFSTGPFYLASAVLFLLGIGVYREEDMFTQRSVPLKFLDALDARLSGLGSVALLTALFVPFVFVAELLAVAVLFALPVTVSLPLLLVAIAFVEEVAKSVHVYAGFAKSRFDRTPRTALVLGTVSGLGFFVAEKATVVVQVVGLPELALGRAAFSTAGVVAGAGPLGLLALFLAPLVLHAVTAAISALGASRGLRSYGASLGAAVLVHAAYNFTVVSSLG